MPTKTPARENIAARENRSCFGQVGLAIWFFVSLGGAPSTGFALNNGEFSASRTVAEVNSIKITQGELDSVLKQRLGEGVSLLSPEKEQLARRRVLETLVERELLIQAATRARLVPGDDEVDSLVRELQGSTDSPAAIQSRLVGLGLDEQRLRKGLRDDLGVRAYLDKVIFAGLHVSSTELVGEFNKNRQRYQSPIEIRARHILFKLNNDASPDEENAVRERARKILSELKESGSDFGAFARRYSEASNKANGGDLGFITENQLDPTFSKVAFQLELNKLSDLIRTPLGYHIIKVEERRGGEQRNLEDVKERIYQSLLNEKRDAALLDHLKQLRKSAKIIVYLN